MSNKYQKGMVETKPSCSPEKYDLKNSTYEHKGKWPKTNMYWVKKTQTKTQGLELKAETNSKGRCSNQEGYIFNLGPRASYKFARTMKELEQYIGKI